MYIKFTPDGPQFSGDEDANLLSVMHLPTAADVRIEADTGSLVIDLEAKLGELKNLLEQSSPDIANHIRSIHSNLHKNPELVYMLKPELLGNFTKAASVVRNISLIQKEEKKKAETALKRATSRAPKKALSDFDPEDV